MLETSALCSTLPGGPLEIPTLHVGQCFSSSCIIEARLISPLACTIPVLVVLLRLSAFLVAGRPLEMDFVASGADGDDDLAASTIADWLSHHSHMCLVVSATERFFYSVPVSARPACGGWTARALILPSAWAGATTVTAMSLSLAGRPLPCECLPAMLRVGFNHAPRAPAGAVFAAADAGDVQALEAALYTGGSTEEADEVRVGLLGLVSSRSQGVTIE